MPSSDRAAVLLEGGAQRLAQDGLPPIAMAKRKEDATGGLLFPLLAAVETRLIKSPRDYADYYRMTIEPVLSTFPQAKVGGPAVANGDGELLPAFIDLCVHERTRLDRRLAGRKRVVLYRTDPAGGSPTDGTGI